MTKFRIFASIVLLAGAAGLSACGGGGSESSSGVGTNRANSDYVGTYKGTALFKVQGMGRTVTESIPTTLTISTDGLVEMVLEKYSGNDPQCSGEKPVYVGADGSISSSATLTCSIPQVGTCTIPGHLSGQVTSTAISLKLQQRIQCSRGTITSNVSITAKKQSHAREIAPNERNAIEMLGLEAATLL